MFGKTSCDYLYACKVLIVVAFFEVLICKLEFDVFGKNGLYFATKEIHFELLSSNYLFHRPQFPLTEIT